MKQKGKSTDQALLRTVADKKSQTFSHKRLLKDLKEIEDEKIPTCGVTARPLDNNLFIWHANIKGPEKTLYEGGVFHLKIEFPLSYPNHPPVIKIYTLIPHPNVFKSEESNFICLDMIRQEGKREEGQGWSSAYSAQSILIQLQSFLFEENLSKNKQEVELETKKAVKEANEFKCKDCKHGGKLSCWPPFSSKDVVSSEYSILLNENDLIRRELICYHTKLSYLENQLGLGLRVSKVPKTGNIREAETFYDYISIKAFLKESINKTSYNERITHWIPVYFGEGDNEGKFLKFMTKSFSMIMTGSTRNFKKEFVLEVLPKLIITIAYYIMDEKKYPSIRNIRLLTHIHSIFLFCIKQFPELGDSIKQSLT
jgi:ubiquitin-protein ligase